MTPHPGQRILLVEDDAGLRLALTAALALEGIEVVAEATGGADALALLRALDDAGDLPDAVVTDFTLDGVNGLTLARTIRAAWPELPVLFITGHDDEVVLDAGLHAGAEVAILKSPDLVTDLSAALRARA